MQHEGGSGREVVEVWRGVILKSAKVIYPLSIFCCLFASPIVERIYGPEYREAAIFLQLVTPVTLLRVVPYSPVLLALGRGRLFSRIHLGAAVVLILAEAVCVRCFPSAVALALINTLCTAGALGALLCAVRSAVRVGWRQLLPAGSLAGVLALSAVASGASRLAVGSVCGWSGLAAAFSLAALLYAGLCAVCGISYRELWQPLLALLPRRRGDNGKK
ncbi:MAG: hypothetical protein K2H69_04320 [Alistipes sp.]|nr:hypothetical protein [Alistipes sp.]